MARTKDAVLAPGQKELMEKEYLDFVKPSTYGNKANPSSCNSLYDDVENPELRAIVEKVAATTPYREETSTNEAQSPPNPQKRISGKQRKATLEEYQQTFLQVPRIDDRKPVFALADVKSVTLLDNLPDEKFYRSDGSEDNSKLLGNFRGSKTGHCQMYIWIEHPPVLQIKTTDTTIFLNSSSEAQTKEWYNQLNDAISSNK